VDKPSVYLFYGDDSLAIREEIHKLRGRLGTAADLNLQRFAAGTLDLVAFQQACATPPFGADRRLILLEDAGALPHEVRPDLERILARLPATSGVVLIERIDTGRSKDEAKQLKQSFGWPWVEAHAESSFKRRFARPRGPAFAGWLQERARSGGGLIEPAAARALGERMTEDPLLADQELEKLLDYTDRDRAITEVDVERLTADYAEQGIFAMLDRLGSGTEWLGQLEQLLQEQDPRGVFGMLARQIRLLIKARSALDRSENPTPAIRSGEEKPPPDFVCDRVTAQARRFSLARLLSIHRGLTELDLAVKRGQADLELDLLPTLAGLTR
jgi:DNA polymerase-3 subunit delta